MAAPHGPWRVMVALNLVNRPNKRRQAPDQVSELTTNRLSIYLRCLNELDAGGVRLVSSITVEAVRELGLREGSEVVAIVKASDVLIGLG